jgi:cytochrome c
MKAKDAGNAEKGRLLFMQFCSKCHSVETTEAQHGDGPSLQTLYGRKVGSLAGFNYSHALRNMGKVDGKAWSKPLLLDFLKNPKEVVPEAKVPGAHTKKSPDREDIAAYLETLNKPKPI